MANELLPHYHSRMPAAAVGTTGYLDAADGVAHAYAGRFPTGYNPADLDDQTLSPLSGVEVATNVDEVVGGEGIATPYGAAIAPNLAGMTGVTSSTGATPWTTGSYVTLGDGSTAYWNGTAWVAGVAP